MKKLIFVLGFVLLVFSCNIERENQKITKASQVDTVLVMDGLNNEVKIPINGILFYSVNPELGYISLDSLFRSSEDFEDFIRDQFRRLEFRCRHPRTFVPEEVKHFRILDTLSVEFLNKRVKLYAYEIFVSGLAKNSFGVEGDVQDFVGTETNGSFISEKLYDIDGDRIHYYITRFNRVDDEYYYYIPFNYSDETYYLEVSKRDIDFQNKEQINL